MKPARCSRPPMEHVYAAEADDRGRSFCGNLEIFFRLVGKTILFWTLVITVITENIFCVIVKDRPHDPGPSKTQVCTPLEVDVVQWVLGFISIKARMSPFRFSHKSAGSFLFVGRSTSQRVFRKCKTGFNLQLKYVSL